VEVALENLAEFIHWLRNPESRVVSIQTVEAKRTEKTINAILAAVSGFYEFQERNGTSEGVDIYRYQFRLGKYKSFLPTSMQKVRTLLLKLKDKKVPRILSQEQVKQLVTACKRKRDFLICLLTKVRAG